MRIAVKAAAKCYYGTAAPAFLEGIIAKRAELPAVIATLRHAFLAKVLPPDASGQATRVAMRFALGAVAGKLATKLGITGWPAGTAEAAAKTCFGAWLEGRGGAGNQESTAMLAQVRRFFELHGEARFTPWPRDGETCEGCSGTGKVEFTTYERGVCFDCQGSGRLTATAERRLPTRDRAGFRREHDGWTEYFMLPEAFRQDVCAGFDAKAMARLLVERGILNPAPDGKASRPERLPGMGRVRCYVFTRKLWEMGS